VSTTIYCPNCNAEIPPENININGLIAKCVVCGKVFNFADQVETPVSFARAEYTDVHRPDSIEVENLGHQLIIKRRWFTPEIVVLAIFALFWNGTIVFVMGTAFAMGAGFISLFGSLHAAVGIYLAYTVLAGFLNTTVITADMQTLAIRHGPIPWPGNREVASSSIKQLYCREHMKRRKRGYSYTYSIQALLNDTSLQALVKGLQSPEQALYVEQEIERHLGIKDEPVRGEIAR
jgi:hypothetical protein